MTATPSSVLEGIEAQPSGRRRMTIHSAPEWIRMVIAVAAVALVALGGPLPVGPTLLLGVAVLLYALASMAGDAPADRGST